jgi:peptidoglycan/LPS O-acetylase OafA/YrhL
MLDFIAPFLAGVLVEYFRSRGISKWKVFVSSLFIFTGLFIGYVIFNPSDKNLYIGLAYALAFGTFCAIVMVAVLRLSEIFVKNKKQENGERLN